MYACALTALATPAAARAQAACTVDTLPFAESFAAPTYRDAKSSVLGWPPSPISVRYHAGAFTTPPGTRQFGERVLAAVGGDFDGDGLADVIVLSDQGSCHLDFFRGDGQGNLTPAGTVATCSGTPSAAVLSVGDVDHDGRLDLALATVTAPNQAGTIATAVLLRGGAPVAGQPTFAAVDIAPTLSAAQVAWHVGGSQMALFDWDGDGRDDLMVLSSSGSSSQVLLFTAQPTFGIAATPAFLLGDAGLTPPFPSASTAASGGFGCPPAVGRGGTVLAPADFTGDGLPDLIVASSSEQVLHMFVQAGDGTLTQTSALRFPAGGAQWGLAVDLDGEGSSDLVIGRSGNDCGGPPASLWRLLNDGSGNLTLSQSQLPVGGTLQFAAAFDATGNKTPDLIAGKLTGIGAAFYFENAWANVAGATCYNLRGTALTGNIATADPKSQGVVGLHDLAIAPPPSNGSGHGLAIAATNDGGHTWDTLTPTELAAGSHTFSSFGADLRLRLTLTESRATSGTCAALDPGAANSIAQVSSVRLAYDVVGPAQYSRSGLAQGTVVDGSGTHELIFSSSFSFPSFTGTLTAFDLTKLARGSTAAGTADRVDTSSDVIVRWEAGALLAGQSGAARTLYTAYPTTTQGVDPVSVRTSRIPFTAAEAQSGSSTPTLATMMGITALSATERGALFSFLVGGMGDPNGWKLRDGGHGSPVFVGAPSGDPAYLGSGYAAFQAAQASRAPRVYMGSNDGVWHAFDAATGAEVYGLVPYNLLAKMRQQRGIDAAGQPAYRHDAFVDGGTTVQDINYQGAWHTVAVIGQAQGQGLLGNNYYLAVDITDPTRPTPLWEFSDIWRQIMPGCSLAANTATSCTPSCHDDVCSPACSAYNSIMAPSTSSGGAIEAEHFDNLAPAPVGGATWAAQAGPLNGAAMFPFTPPRPSRGGYMQATGAAACAGGTTAAMQACAALSYRVRLTAAGTFRPYFRIYPTTTTDDALSWGIDGSYVEAVAAGPETGTNYLRNTWWWAPGSSVSLAAGEHTLTVWMRSPDLRLDTIALMPGSVLPVDTTPETCGQSCSQACTASCTTTTYSSPSTTEWPQCGVGAGLQCCGVQGGDAVCAPVGTTCPTPESIAGQTFSAPAIGRVRVGSNTVKWVAFFASGINNPSRPQAPNVGRALYAVDAFTGQLMAQWNFGDIPSGSNNASTLPNAVPGGVALVDVNDDQFVDRVYVGDLEGRLWKVDTFQSASVNGAGAMTNPGAYPACVLFDAGDPSASGQRGWAPISTRPAVAVIQAGTSNVYFGTGGDDRAPDTGSYRFYSVRDDDPLGTCRSTPKPIASLAATAQEWIIGDGLRNDTGGPLARSDDEGAPGDRYWADPTIANGEVVYFVAVSGKLETANPCTAATGNAKIFGIAVRNYVDASGRKQQAGLSTFGAGVPWIRALGKVRQAPLVRTQVSVPVPHGATAPPPRGRTDVLFQSFAGGGASKPSIQRITEQGTSVQSPLRLLRWREVPM